MVRKKDIVRCLFHGSVRPSFGAQLFYGSIGLFCATFPGRRVGCQKFKAKIFELTPQEMTGGVNYSLSCAYYRAADRG